MGAGTPSRSLACWMCRPAPTGPGSRASVAKLRPVLPGAHRGPVRATIPLSRRFCATANEKCIVWTYRGGLARTSLDDGAGSTTPSRAGHEGARCREPINTPRRRAPPRPAPASSRSCSCGAGEETRPPSAVSSTCSMPRWPPPRLRQSGRPESVEELVHEVFVRVWRHAPTFVPGAQGPVGWVMDHVPAATQSLMVTSPAVTTAGRPRSSTVMVAVQSPVSGNR